MGIIVYADDTTLACKGWYELQQLIPIFMDYCKKYDIKANPNKTLWMKMGETVRYDEQKIPIIGAPNINEKFVINEVTLKKTDRFKFLGFWLLANGSNSEHVSKRISMAYAAVNDIIKLGFHNLYLDIKIKGYYYTVFIRPILSYALENARVTENDILELEKTEAKILKKACGLPFRSFTKPIINAMKIIKLFKKLFKKKYIIEYYLSITFPSYG